MKFIMRFIETSFRTLVLLVVFCVVGALLIGGFA